MNLINYNFYYKQYERMIMEAYCVKCKKKTEIKDPKDVTMKNGKAAVTGICSVCGTKVFRIKSSK